VLAAATGSLPVDAKEYADRPAEIAAEHVVGLPLNVPSVWDERATQYPEDSDSSYPSGAGGACACEASMGGNADRTCRVAPTIGIGDVFTSKRPALSGVCGACECVSRM